MVNPSEIELVVARLRAMPDTVIVSDGASVLGRDALIERVKNANNNETGRKLVEARMAYLRSVGRH